MIGIAMQTTIETLWKKGYNKTQIARMCRRNWRTVARAIKRIESGEPYPEKKAHPKKLERYKERICVWLEEGLSGVRIHEELVRIGSDAHYATVKRYCADIKKRENIYVRIHTNPGEEAQVHFGYVGMTPDNTGKKRKTWVFNMRLSYSRLDYYEKVYDQRVETFIECHSNAFIYFGCVPHTVRIDNLKAAILESNFYEPVFQRLYQECADYYGFQCIPCRVYHPNDKGKVESGINYVKSNFFLGRSFKSADDLRLKLFEWFDKKANNRIHGTTRKIPREVFETTEKQHMNRLPNKRYELASVGMRRVYHDCHIYVQYNYYSVPFEYVGKDVEVRMSKDIVRILYHGKELTIHTRLAGKGMFSTNQTHYPAYKRYSQTEYQEQYQKKMAQIGPFAEQLFLYIIDIRKRDWSRPIQGIISLKKSFPNNIIERSCKRALAYGIIQYQTIKNICVNGSYALPIEFTDQQQEVIYASS